MASAEQIVEACDQRGLTIACAESLTGGLVCAELTAMPGASSVVLGGIVTYSTESKARVLGVDSEALALWGPVSENVAAQMARQAALRFGAAIGVATTGVAGPSPVGAHPAGEVFIAIHTPARGELVRRCMFNGGRQQIRRATVLAALDLVAETLELGVSEVS